MPLIYGSNSERERGRRKGERREKGEERGGEIGGRKREKTYTYIPLTSLLVIILQSLYDMIRRILTTSSSLFLLSSSFLPPLTDALSLN